MSTLLDEVDNMVNAFSMLSSDYTLEQYNNFAQMSLEDLQYEKARLLQVIENFTQKSVTVSIVDTVTELFALKAVLEQRLAN